VFTVSQADGNRLAALREVAEVVPCPGPRLDLAACLRWLGERGVRRVLCEGGPTLNAALLEAGLVDELFLTVAPRLVGGPAGRIVSGPGGLDTRLQLEELREHRGELLARYRVVR
jgi:riboflavin biosynthesis pyrimidine reductase